LSQSVIQVKPS